MEPGFQYITQDHSHRKTGGSRQRQPARKTDLADRQAAAANVDRPHPLIVECVSSRHAQVVQRHWRPDGARADTRGMNNNNHNNDNNKVKPEGATRSESTGEVRWMEIITGLAIAGAHKTPHASPPTRSP